VRRALVLGGIALAFGVASCLVDRKTSDLRCSEDRDCAAHKTRVCDRDLGYCVPADCPSVCDECNLGTKSCEIRCDSAGECGALSCPPGWSCDITCSANNACGTIDCRGARSCDITCSAVNACDDIDCGHGDTACTVACNGPRACDNIECADGPCSVTCNGNNACDYVDCRDSCACEVQCDSGACLQATCSDPTCDTAAGCSADRPGCDVCP
jgi:hypothetical protein